MQLPAPLYLRDLISYAIKANSDTGKINNNSEYPAEKGTGNRKKYLAFRKILSWNNELLGAMSLKADGVLEPWKGRGYGRIPENFKDPDGCWTGFAARLRVYIVNTDKIPSPGEKDLAARMAGPDLSRAAIGKPLYGTTLSHYCCLWSELGGDKLKEMHKDMLARKLMVLNGNAAVKNAVAGGACDFGWTDTGDMNIVRGWNGKIRPKEARPSWRIAVFRFCSAPF